MLPRLVLYSRKSALGVGLMPPKNIVSTLALKLWVGHNKYKSNLSKIIKTDKENARLCYGHLSIILKTSRELKPKVVIWSDEIQEMLSTKKLEFINYSNEKK